MWSTGLSWTKKFDEASHNPDGTIYVNHGHCGPFLFIRKLLFDWKFFEFYIGMKPTAGYDPKFDSFWFVRLLSPVINYLNNRGFGNLGFALRLKSK